MKKLLVALLAVLMVVSMLLGAVACQPKTPEEDKPEDNTPTYDADAYKNLYLLEYGEDKDYISLWDKYGTEVKLSDVKTDDDGLAYIEKDGKTYPLGLDFLTMAMVYTVDETKDEAGRNADYATWFKYYMTRWNYLLPEMPLYSNQYYDVYNAKLGKVKDNSTNPFWGVVNALIDWTSTDGQIIIGNTTDLSGTFRYPSYKTSSPGAADNDINKLIVGLETVVSNKEGNLQWNSTVVKSHKETVNEDGSKTFEIEINDGLKYSDGSAVKAADYVVTTLVFSSAVTKAATGVDKKAGMSVVGFDTYAKYEGAAAEGATKEFSGIRVLSDTKFSVTISPDYLPYFYDTSYASFAPTYPALWLDKATIKDDGNGAYISDEFYAKTGDAYAVADHINTSAKNTDETYPYSGPYVVKSYDEATKTATLEKNPNFAGNYQGIKPAIDKVVYKKIVSSTQMADFQAGGIDVIAGITGGEETDEALKVVNESNGKYDYVTYARAGYGKLGFRCDFGPTQFQAVRQAIAYCVDRATFAKTFTGGYGGVVDGPYYSGAWMYKEAVKNGMQLNTYATSADKAIEVLKADGWIYNAEGGAYTEGVRYKKIPASQMSEADKTFQSKDAAYKTVQIGDYYYMPLVLNWYGTTDNPFTEQLKTGFATEANILAAGFNVQQTVGEFYPMLAELVQGDYGDGVYGGTPLYNCFNFATGFNSAIYDYSYNMTINPDYYDDYSSYYIKDAADFYIIEK